MLRYREDLGLLPPVRAASSGRGPRHRQFGDADLRAVTAALQMERRYQVSPAAIAFGLRVLSEPAVRVAVADLSRRLGRLPEQPGRALDFEQERALRLLGRPAGQSGPAVPGRTAVAARTAVPARTFGAAGATGAGVTGPRAGKGDGSR
jgi:hypothetical protein